MADELHLTTCDPRFDPDKGVRINGYWYVPVGRIDLREGGERAPNVSPTSAGD